MEKHEIAVRAKRCQPRTARTTAPRFTKSRGAVFIGAPLDRDRLCFRRHSSPGFRAKQGYADAVNEIGDGNAEAAADDETASAVEHPLNLDHPVRLQTELHQTVLALPPLISSNTLKIKKQNPRKNKHKNENKNKHKNKNKNQDKNK